MPPLNQLRAFEAAARHGSFKDAAEELHVTQAAVSHQIKALEDDLGHKLFIRMTRQVRLTPKGEALSPVMSRAFEDMAAAILDVRGDALEGELIVSVAPFFGNRMILPILPDFHAEFPGIRIRPDMGAEIVDFDKSDFHCAIRYGTGEWKGLVKIHLAHNLVAPFAAPSFLENWEPPVALEDIAGMTLGSVSGRRYHWTDWFAAQGYDPGDRLMLIDYNNKARALDLALAGNGVALDDVFLMAGEVEAGRLVQLHPFVHQQGTSMYLVYPEALKNDARLRAFGDWLERRFSHRREWQED